jgi:asparagine synthase (glutamine-hydrolysing)
MCGICGIVDLGNQSIMEAPVRDMMRIMKHRGPDDEGVFLEKNLGLGFVRLSIIDLSSAGHQPMLSDDKRYVVVFNGEIYNYIELRNELISKGHCFRTRSDTEVLLAAYHEWGDECLHKFNGMWAFVIYDRKRGTLFCARDRYGVKPFYYTLDKGRIIFASEIPPILEVLSSKPSPNYQAIYDFLVFNRTDQTEDTFFAGIKKLQHGHFIRLDLNCDSTEVIERSIVPGKWYDLRSSLREPFNTAEEFYGAFTSAVALRLRSDVPIGVCLSGGLDSSSIASVLLKEFNMKDLKTFSAVYQEGDKGDESPFINEYKSQVKDMYFTTPSAKSLSDDLQSFIKAHGEPVPSTAPYAQFKVMELAKGNVAVTLDGQGADELLAGYHYFFGIYFKSLLKKFKWGVLLREIIHYLKNHSSFYGIITLVYFLLPTWLKINIRESEKAYLDHDFAKKYSKTTGVPSRLYSSPDLQSSLLDHFEYKLEHLLKWEDRNSMWFSLEARVPFLDYRLVEQTISMPSDKIIRNGTTKYILREAMRGTLSEKIRMRQDKIGFDTPQDEWFRHDFFVKYITELLTSDSFRSRKLINPYMAQRLCDSHIRRKTDVSKEIWKWINLELWFREFID